MVQTLFKGGPNAVDREFKTYELVWFLKKKTVKVTQNVVEINFLLKFLHEIHIFTSGHILLTIAFKCTGDSIHLAIIEFEVNGGSLP